MAYKFRLVSVIAAAWVSVGTPVLAADISTPKPVFKAAAPAPSPWEFRFTPYAWLIFISGEQTIGTTTSDIDTNLFQIFDQSDHLYAWMSYQEFRNGPMALYLDVVWSRMRFSDTRSGIFPIGPLNRSSLNIVGSAKIWLDLAIIEPGIALEIARWPAGAASIRDGQAFVPTTAVDLIAGARYWYMRPDIDLGVTATVSIPVLNLARTGSGQVSASKTIDWWDPLVGLRLRHKLAPGQELELRGDIGGFGVGSRLTWQAIAAYNFEMQLLGFKLNSYIGYRALSIDYQEGSGNQTIALDLITHGPVVGMNYRW